MSEATQRWANSGLTQAQLATLRAVKFEVTDLSGSYLGEADGNRILVDRNAQGRGWFIDANPLSDLSFAQAVSATRRYTDPMNAAAGHLDLLTAIEHEMGHRLGLPDTYAAKDRDHIMYGYLTVGERRLPAQGQAFGSQTFTRAKAHFLSLGTDENRSPRVSTGSEPQSGAMFIAPGSRDDHQLRRSGMLLSTGTNIALLQSAGSYVNQDVYKHSVPTGLRANRGASDRQTSSSHAHRRMVSDQKPLTPQSGGTVNLPIGTITPGSTVVLTYQVTVNNAAPAGTSQISNQGTVTSNAPTVSTDDPDIVGASNPTVTPLLAPTAASGFVSGRITDANGNPVEGAVVRLSGGQSRKTDHRRERQLSVRQRRHGRVLHRHAVAREL